MHEIKFFSYFQTYGNHFLKNDHKYYQLPAIQKVLYYLLLIQFQYLNN